MSKMKDLYLDLIEKIVEITGVSYEEATKQLDDHSYYCQDIGIITDVKDGGVNSLGHKTVIWTVS